MFTACQLYMDILQGRQAYQKHDVAKWVAGKNFVRDDSETPEDTAAGNIAKAQQSSGNAIDSIKCVHCMVAAWCLLLWQTAAGPSGTYLHVSVHHLVSMPAGRGWACEASDDGRGGTHI